MEGEKGWYLINDQLYTAASEAVRVGPVASRMRRDICLLVVLAPVVVTLVNANSGPNYVLAGLLGDAASSRLCCSVVGLSSIPDLASIWPS